MELLQEYVAHIHHACRQRYYHAMQKIAKESLQKFPNEPTLQFYLSLSYLLQKKTPEALRQLSSLHNNPRVSFGALLASVAGHRACSNIDQEELASLEVKLKEVRKTSKPEELYHAGVYLAFSGKPDKAKEYLDRAIKQSNQHLDALSLRGWVEISLNTKETKGKGNTSAMDYFDAVLKLNRKHIDSNLGAAYFHEQTRHFDEAMEKLNSLLGYYPNWIPSLEEKMKLVLCIQDWDQALDLANRILSSNPSNLEANRLKILYSLCRDGDSSLVVKSLENFFELCKENEPNNAKYFVENARMFSQLGSYNKDVLAQTLTFARYATELELDSAEFVADVGRIFLLMRKYKEAYQEFRAASAVDNASMSAIYGLITCQLAEGNIDLASQQLDFMRELAATIETPPEISYLAAVIAKQRRNPAEQILTFLNEAVDNHFREIRRHPFNISYLKSINPDLVIKIVREYLAFAPQEPVAPGMQPPASVRQATMILEAVVKVCPSHRDALFISAHIKYLSGDLNSACLILNQILKIDQSLLEGYLLMGQIQISKGEFKEASETLEFGLSSNFKVRDHPKYHLLQAKIERNFGDNAKALQSTKEGISLVKASRVSLGKDEGDTKFEIGSPDVLALYMENVAVLRALKRFDEASRVLEEAYMEFKGTHLDGRIALIQAEELVSNGEIDKAIEFLQKIIPEQNHFVESRKLLAEIFLENKHDKQQYTNCFVDIVKQNSSPGNLVMLGDAYMSVQEHDKALEFYDMALSKSPKDTSLALKMGQAYVSTHQFQKAINYYKDAIKSDENFPMRVELATLHMKLKQWDKAEKVLQQALDESRDQTLSGLIMEANLLCLLGKVQQGAGSSNQAQQSLIKAKECQARVLKRTILEQPTFLVKQKLQFALICKQLGEIVEKPNDIEFAIRNLKEALNLCPGDSQLLTTMSKLYLKVDDQVNCQTYCEQLLQVKPESLDANVMLGELYFRHYHDFGKAAQYFQQILDIHPTHFSSLVWCIECARRCGKLSDAEPYIKRASDRCDSDDPGLGYCIGLFDWYNGNSNSAVKMLNIARKDPVFGRRAIMLMVDIYLSPSLGLPGGDSSDSNDSKLSAESKETAINIAETLIGDLPVKNSEEKFHRQMLDNLALIATRNKAKLDKAIQELNGLNITEHGRDSVVLVYALANALAFTKQHPRARNQLKRVVRQPWTFEDAEYLEGCWIMLADTYVQGSKYDMATDMIRKVLMYNKGCAKAHELLGFIMEKEQAYADAAADYELAWKLSSCSNAALGYKLAFNYLKAKRYTDAIDVCHIVLSKSPNYPKIRKEILEKARANLRP